MCTNVFNVLTVDWHTCSLVKCSFRQVTTSPKNSASPRLAASFNNPEALVNLSLLMSIWCTSGRMWSRQTRGKNRARRTTCNCTWVLENNRLPGYTFNQRAASVRNSKYRLEVLISGLWTVVAGAIPGNPSSQRMHRTAPDRSSFRVICSSFELGSALGSATRTTTRFFGKPRIELTHVAIYGWFSLLIKYSIVANDSFDSLAISCLFYFI